MDKKTTLSAIALVLGGLLVGGVVGNALGSAGTGSAKVAPPVDEEANGPDASRKIEFPVNASGETFGRGDLEVVPDLVFAYGDNGAKGYVRDDELFDLGGGSMQVPLYASDGVTVLGTFTVQG